MAQCFPHSNAPDAARSASDPSAQLLDYAAFHAKMEGDCEFIRQVLLAFVQDAPPKLAALRLAVAEGNLEQAGRIAHSLKGISGAICAHAVHALGKDIEQLARDGDAGPLPRILDALEETMRATLAAIGEKLEEPKSSSAGENQ